MKKYLEELSYNVHFLNLWIRCYDDGMDNHKHKVVGGNMSPLVDQIGFFSRVMNFKLKLH
jgi:hypothetical protein